MKSGGIRNLPGGLSPRYEIVKTFKDAGVTPDNAGLAEMSRPLTWKGFCLQRSGKSTDEEVSGAEPLRERR